MKKVKHAISGADPEGSRGTGTGFLIFGIILILVGALGALFLGFLGEYVLIGFLVLAIGIGLVAIKVKKKSDRTSNQSELNENAALNYFAVFGNLLFILNFVLSIFIGSKFFITVLGVSIILMIIGLVQLIKRPSKYKNRSLTMALSTSLLILISILVIIILLYPLVPGWG